MLFSPKWRGDAMQIESLSDGGWLALPQSSRLPVSQHDVLAPENRKINFRTPHFEETGLGQAGLGCGCRDYRGSSLIRPPLPP